MAKKILLITCCLLSIFYLKGCLGTSENRKDDAITKNKTENSIELIQEISVFPQLGHSDVVFSVVSSPDGRYILSGSRDSTICLWDVESGREIRIFSGHNSTISSVSFSPDGKRFVSGSWDATIRLWDIESDREIRTLNGHTSRINSVSFGPDGKHLLSGSDDGTIRLWDIGSGRTIRTLSGHTDKVSSVDFSPDGKRFVSGSYDRTVRLWDVESGHVIRIFNGHESRISSVSFSPDGMQIISGSSSNDAVKKTEDKNVRLWDLGSGNEVRTFVGHTEGVTAVSFSNDGKYILSGSLDGSVRLWDKETGREIRTFTGHNGYIWSVSFSHNGMHFFSGSHDRTIRLWSIESGNEIRTYTGYIRSVNSVDFSPDGRQILSGSQDGKARLWNIESGREIRTFTGHKEWILSVSFSPNGKQILSASSDYTIRLWDTESGREIRTFESAIDHLSGSPLASFSPDGKRVLSPSRTTIRLWDAESGRIIRNFVGHTGYITLAGFSPNGGQILSYSPLGSDEIQTRTIRLWDTDSGQVIRVFTGNISYVNSISFSSDGKRFLSSSDYETTIRLWDIESGREIRTFKGHTGRVNSVSFSPDNKQILSGSNDGTIRLWETECGREIRKLSGHSGFVESVRYNPNGTQILSGSSDSTTRLWDIETGKEIAQFISFTDGEWICITTDGYYNASPNGDKYLNVRIGNQVYGIDQYRNIFYSPDIIALALSDNKNNYLAAVQQHGKTMKDNGITPPNIIISSPTSGLKVPNNLTNISVSVDGGSRNIEHITVKVNGKMVAQDYGITPQGAKGLAPMARLAVLTDGNANKRQANFNLAIPLDPGNNIIEVLAFNGYSEGRALVEVTYQTTQTSLPNLYILSIGVNNYIDNSIPSLRYAANDARNIVQAFKAQEGKRYGSVRSLILADGGDREPTRDNIADSMDFLRNARQEDVIMLFLSGHGGTDEHGNFFFMPGNMAFNQNGTPQRSRIIPNSELQDVLRFPGQKLVFIDSCYSGGITGRQVGIVNNESLINSLKDDSPVVFTSSSRNERSWEWDSARLGLFTHVLLQGLQGSADVNRDSKITVTELGEYIKKTVPSMKDNQTPYYLVPTGYKNFIIAEVK